MKITEKKNKNKNKKTKQKKKNKKKNKKQKKTLQVNITNAIEYKKICNNIIINI